MKHDKTHWTPPASFNEKEPFGEEYYARQRLPMFWLAIAGGAVWGFAIYGLLVMLGVF